MLQEDYISTEVGKQDFLSKVHIKKSHKAQYYSLDSRLNLFIKPDKTQVKVTTASQKSEVYHNVELLNCTLEEKKMKKKKSEKSDNIFLHFSGKTALDRI